MILEGRKLREAKDVTEIAAEPQSAKPWSLYNPVLTVGSQTFTAHPVGEHIIAGQTLRSDGNITVSRTHISLAPSASALIVGGSTQARSKVSTNSGLAGLIMSASGGPCENSTSAMGDNDNGQIFTGGSIKELQVN